MKRVVVIVLTMLLGVAVAQETPEEILSGVLPDAELLQRLQSGGLVLVFRHGETGPDPDRGDAVSGFVHYPGSIREKQAAYLACDRQRVLTDAGRAQMVRTGNLMQTAGVLIGEVYASPLCRTRESAWLLAGRVVPTDALIGPGNDERDRLVTTKPDGEYNRILVSHAYVVAGLMGDFDRATRDRFIPRGHAFVLDPDGSDGFDVLARLGPVDWARLAELASL